MKLNEAVDVAQYTHFAQKLRLHGMKCALNLAKSLNGNRGTYCNAIIQEIFQRKELLFFLFPKQKLRKLVKGYDLLSMLLRKYEDNSFT